MIYKLRIILDTFKNYNPSTDPEGREFVKLCKKLDFIKFERAFVPITYESFNYKGTITERSTCGSYCISGINFIIVKEMGAHNFFSKYWDTNLYLVPTGELEEAFLDSKRGLNRKIPYIELGIKKERTTAYLNRVAKLLENYQQYVVL